jgi:hypothetical protein
MAVNGALGEGGRRQPNVKLVHFGSLDFIVTTGGGLKQIHVLVRPTRTANLDPVVEGFEGLRLHTLGGRASEGDWLLDFNSRRLRHKLRAFLGPRPTQEDLCQVLFSLTNITAQLSGGESLSPKIMAGNASTTFTYTMQLRMCVVTWRYTLVRPPPMTNSWE